MTIKARIKFDDTITAKQMMILTKLGFTYHARKKDEWIIYIKYQKLGEPAPAENVTYHDLSDSVQNDLTRRCNHIYNAFVKPEAHIDTIAARCRNMARTLNAKEREWVHAWVRRVCIGATIDIDEDIPWVIDAEQLKQEVQEKLF